MIIGMLYSDGRIHIGTVNLSDLTPDSKREAWRQLRFASQVPPPLLAPPGTRWVRQVKFWHCPELGEGAPFKFGASGSWRLV